ncbi:MAG: hypothetical protein H0T79_19275 [Deltaproteobacteria bacterium]|nr:hypothetical protein [Deltaproteobacteria bacterium]
MRDLLLLLLPLLLGAAACAPRAMPVSADHPANPDAETGRLAGPPAALRPGVIAERDVQPPARTPKPVPTTPDPPVDAKPVPPPVEKPPTEKPPVQKPAPKKPAPPVEKPAPKQPTPPVEKPAPPKPTGHEGHH